MIVDGDDDMNEVLIQRKFGEIRKYLKKLVHGWGRNGLWHTIYISLGMMRSILNIILLVTALFFSSCEVVEGIFKAGFFSAILLGVLIVALIIWLVSRLRK